MWGDGEREEKRGGVGERLAQGWFLVNMGSIADLHGPELEGCTGCF